MFLICFYFSVFVYNPVISSHACPGCLFSDLIDSSGPSSTVSSAGPSSPTTADTSPRFSFSEKISLTPQSSEETHSSQNISSQPAPTLGPQVDPTCPSVEVPLTPNNLPDEDTEYHAITSEHSGNPECSEEAPAVTDVDPSLRAPCSALTELTLGRMEGYLPGSLPVLLELRESSSEAGSSSQTPQSPEGPDEFFDTQESMEEWVGSPDSPPCPETSPEVRTTHAAEL